MQGRSLHKTFYELLIWTRWLEGILVSALGNVKRANATCDNKDNDQRFQCHHVAPSGCWSLASNGEVIHIAAEWHLGIRFAHKVA